VILVFALLAAGTAVLADFVFGDSPDTTGAETGPSVSAPADVAAQPPSGERRTVVVPERAGPLTRVLERQTRAGGRRSIAEMQAAGLRNAQLGSYAESGAGESVVTLYVGEVTPTLSAERVRSDGESYLDAAFRRLTSSGVVGYDGEMAPADAGPLGGVARCATLTGRDRPYRACGWVDRWTVGYVLDTRRGATTARVAELLLAMRSDVEIVSR
jgi:hypothetical protein